MEDNLSRAIKAIKSGDKATGKKLLVEIIRSEPDNQYAWLWMSKCVIEHKQKRECFERVLRIDPNNSLAQEGLRQLGISQTKLQSKASKKSNNKKPKTLLKVVLVGIVFLFCFLSLSIILKDLTVGSLTNESYRTPIIIDVPPLFGQSLSQIRAKYTIDSYEKLHPLRGYEDVLPTARQSEGYSSGKYSFYVFYNDKQEAVGFQIYDGFESHHLRVGDWRKITQMFNLSVSKSPDFLNSYRAEWNNNSGYRIEVIRNVSSDYVFAVFIGKVR